MKPGKIFAILSSAITIALLVTVIPMAPALAAVGTLTTISPASGPVGTQVSVTGTGFSLSATDTVGFDGVPIITTTTSAGGVLSRSFPVPPATAGPHLIAVIPPGPDTSSNTLTFTVTPQITLSPTSLHAGDYIGITGSGFGASQTVTIYFDGVATNSTPSNASGSFSISLPVPLYTTGGHTVTATDSLANSAAATFTIAAVVTISPSTVTVGTQVTITGSGFGASRSVTIYFEGVSTTSRSSNSSGSFTTSVAVPQNVSGSHTLTANDSLGNTASITYTIIPSVTIDPIPFTGGSQVAVNGDGFAASSNITFYIDGAVIGSGAATSNTLGSFAVSSFLMPTIAGGTHTFQAKDSSNNSATLNFAVTSGIAINPQSGPPGTAVRVTGNGFGADRSVTISFNGVEVDTSPSTPRTDAGGSFTASFTVPPSSGGSHSVVASDGTLSATASFDIVASANLNPVSGPVGTSVTVSGTSFASRGTVVVRYDGSPVATATADINGAFSATFNVPASSTGTHAIAVTDGIRNIPFSFSIAPRVTISPTSGYVGTSITINGAGFTSGGQVSIKYDASQIGTVPADATGGFAVVFNAPASRGGNRSITVTDGTSTIVSTFAMDSTPPPAPTLLSPVDDTQADALAEFQWSAVADPSGVTYEFQLSRDSSFSVLVLEKKGLTTPGYKLTEQEKLESASKQQPYYWRVKAVDGASNESPWTATRTFYVGFVLATWALYAIFGGAVAIAAALGFLLGRRTRRS